jgi:hypothetical protein
MDIKIDPFVKDKTLVFTVTSDGYKYYTWNLYKMLQELKVPWKLCILCLDRECKEFFDRIAQIPSRLYLMPGQHIQHKDPVRFGTPAFKRMNRMKIKALEDLSQRPELDRLIFLDSDIAVFKDFVPYFTEKFLTDSLLFQCDENITGSFECSNLHACTNPCTGVIGMALTAETRPLLKALYKLDAPTWETALTDQDYIASRLTALQTPFAILPRPDFPNGIFLANDRYKQGDPYLVHYNYIIGKNKKSKMIEKECWTLPEYV